MKIISQVSSRLNSLFTATADNLARQCGAVRRVRKFTGSSLAQALVFGWLKHPSATLDELAQTAALCHAPVSPQGIDRRWNDATAAFLRRLLETATEEVIMAEPATAELLDRFAGVHVQDSTVVALPDSLSRFWKACGGSRGQSKSAAKIHVRLDLKRGGLEGPFLDHGRASDYASCLQREPLPAESLWLADLGFFDMEHLAELDQQGVYWVSRIQSHTAVFDEQGRPLDLLDTLKHSPAQAELCVQVGRTVKLPCRLIAVRVPAEVVRRRRARLRKEAKRRGRAASERALQWCRWTVCITRVAEDLLTIADAQVLLKIRWQIELLFKLWKSVGGIDRSRSQRPARILVEFYAKLLAMLVQHWLMLTACWRFPNRSLRRASNAIRQCVVLVITSLESPRRMRKAIQLIQMMLKACAKVRPRRRPAAYQLLEQPELLAA